MADKVEISGCNVETVVEKKADIKFHSSDGSEYTIDSSDGSKFSKDLPLTVPANGKEVKLKIKKNADPGSYQLTMTGNSCDDADTPRPIMIIKVE
ncbi:MAG TPA: hypothetical protein VKM37_08570 [Balneolaceae bacterium]|nr:hypothetical protein [Balneolaceae bacterium]